MPVFRMTVSSSASGNSVPRTTHRCQRFAIEGAAPIRKGVTVIVRTAMASRNWYWLGPTRFSRYPSERRRKENSPICSSPTPVITATRDE